MKAHIKINPADRFHSILKVVLFLILLLKGLQTEAQSVKNFATTQPFLFEENKGQLRDENGNALSDIKYYGKQGGVYIYCKPGMLSFVFTKSEKEPNDISEATGMPVSDLGVHNPESIHGNQRSPLSALRTSITASRMDLVLLNSNPNPLITASDQQEYFENFYTIGDADHGITNVHTYKTLIYKNIYPNIDMLLNVAEKGMEYSFLVHPGGNVSDIKLRWNGAEKEEALKNGGIKYANMLGSMEESAPKSFADGKMIQTSIFKEAKQFSFKVGRYNKGKKLLIDPTLVWATYIGGPNSNAGGIKLDAAGNLYIAGTTTLDNYLTTSGAYQTSYGGNNDIFLAKFSNDGKRLWASYYGGSDQDLGADLNLDIHGNIYITGNTKSSNGIATSGAFKTSYPGGWYDPFLAKFSNSGNLIWATYFGGSNYDESASVGTDSSGNVYIGGWASSTSGIATSGAQQTYPQGGADAFLAKFNSSGSLTWATYYGGSGQDYLYGMSTDAKGNCYLTGTTTSSSGIAFSGFQSNYYGDTDFNGTVTYGGDAFLAKFNSSGRLQWGTYYGGSGGDDASGVTTDTKGNVYITGSTTSLGRIATTGAFQTSRSGDADGFLVKFNSSGSRIWGTYYGGNWNANLGGISLDSKGNIYCTGSTNSDSGIATVGAYETSNKSGHQDIILAKFNNTGNRIWATYLGGNGTDDAGESVIDSSGNLYFTGSSQSTDLATYNAYQSNIETFGNYFGIIAKFTLNTYQNDAGILPTLDSVSFCKTQNIFVRLKNFGGKDLDSVKVGLSINHKFQTKYNWTGKLKPDSTVIVDIGSFSFNTGHDTVIAWTLKPNGLLDSLQGNDTAIISLTQKANAGGNFTICSGGSIRIGSNPISGRSYSWTSIPAGFTSTISDPYVNPHKNTTYYLIETINATGCSDTDSSSVVLLPNARASFSYKTGCVGETTIFIDSSSLAKSYFWYFGDHSGSSDSSMHLLHLYNDTGTYSVFLKVTNSDGCSDSISKNITPRPKPKAEYSFNNVCPGDSISFVNKSSKSNSYYWDFGDGTSSTDSTPPKHLYSKLGSYDVSLVVINSANCADSISKTVMISPCVWPGDANYDKVDNIYDLLAIGIAYNDTGFKRTDTTTQWYAHPCMDWSKNFKSGANHKHADCNGDGKVDSLDMAAIVRNYSKSHSKSGGSITSGNPNDPALSLSISKDSVGTSDTITVQMNLGTATKSMSNIYGICYTVTYDPVNVGRAKSFSADFSNCWMGTVGKNLVYLVHNDSVNGVMDIGITRTDHKNVSGYGEIGKLTIITPDNVGGKRLIRKELRFGLENIKAIDNVEDDVSLYIVGDSVLFYGYSAGIAPQTNIDNNIHLYPNPAQSTMHIDAGKELISEIGISDILGRKVMTLKHDQVRQTDMNISSLIPGTYFIYILTDHGFARSRFVKD